MILEHAVLHVRPGLADEFRAAFAQASPIIEASPGFRSLRLLPCIEDEERFLLLVKWDRMEDHIEDFPRFSGVRRLDGAPSPVL